MTPEELSRLRELCERKKYFLWEAWKALPELLNEVERLREALGVSEMLRSEDADQRGQRDAVLNEANKLLDQTIEVLEGYLGEGPAQMWWRDQAKPLLDNLKAQKKDGSSN